MNVDVHLNTETARSSLMDMFANIRPIPLEEQIRRESDARMARQVSPQQAGIAATAAPFLAQQGLSFSNVARAFGSDMSRFGGNVGSALGGAGASAWNAGASVWNAGHRFGGSVGAFIGNAGSALWNAAINTPGHIANERLRSSLIASGYSGRDLSSKLLSTAEFRAADRIVGATGNQSLTGLMTGVDKFFTHVKREIASHNRAIRDLEKAGLKDQAEILKQSLNQFKANAQGIEARGASAMAAYANNAERQRYGGGISGFIGSKVGGRLGGLISRAGGAFSAAGALYLAKDGLMDYNREKLAWSNIALDSQFVAGADNFAIERQKRLNAAEQSGKEKWSGKGFKYGAGVGAMVGSFFGPLGTAIGAGVGGLIGWGAGYFMGGDYEKNKEDEKIKVERENQLKTMRFGLMAQEKDARFRAGESQYNFAMEEKMRRTGYAGRLEILNRRAQELDAGFAAGMSASEKRKYKEQLMRDAKNGTLPTDTSLFGIDAALAGLEESGQQDSEQANKLRQLRTQRASEIMSIKNRREQMMTENPLTYLTGRQVTDAMSAKGMGIGAQVDVQSVNRDILSEIRKSNVKLDQICRMNDIGARGPTINVSAPRIGEN